jgi:hypothetical protein
MPREKSPQCPTCTTELASYGSSPLKCSLCGYVDGAQPARPVKPAESQVAFVFGLDLGQAQDFSALAMLKQTREGDVARYDVVHLHHWHLGTPYTTVVSETAGMLAKTGSPDCCLAIDGTGVGRAVVDIFMQANLAAYLVPILITSGNSVSRAPDGYIHVSKIQLVSVMQSLMQRRLIRFAKKLTLAKTTEKELANFKVKITTAANETFAADWREGQHDDLVLAVALGAWVAENALLGPWTLPEDRENRSVLDRAPKGVFLDRDDDDAGDIKFPW